MLSSPRADVTTGTGGALRPKKQCGRGLRR
jgi:hypothetical protein